jgi:hypothetical protein
MTDFRTKGTIIGPMGLTAVFGMGTGVTPSVWSPTKRQAAVFRTAWHVFGACEYCVSEPLRWDRGSSESPERISDAET